MVQIRNRKRKGLTETVSKNIYTIHPFPWDCSSIGQSTAQSRRKLRVRAPSIPLDTNPKKEKINQFIFCVFVGNQIDKQNWISNGAPPCFFICFDAKGRKGIL